MKSQTTRAISKGNETLPPGYLVYTDKCKIRALDAFAPDVMKLYQKDEYLSCQPPFPLTSTRINWTTFGVELVLDMKLKNSESFTNTSCYYQEILRDGTGEHTDFKYR